MPEKKSQPRKYTTITIPQPLFNKIKKKIEPTGFSSVSDYVTYVLRETMAELDGGRKGEKSSVIEKLKALGYA